ncbi:MAG: hypothetical protein ACOYUZ_01270 [Patescibacteria group bacterium]
MKNPLLAISILSFASVFGCAAGQQPPAPKAPPIIADDAAQQTANMPATQAQPQQPNEEITCAKENGQNICRVLIVGNKHEALGDRTALACEHNLDAGTLSCRVSYSKPLVKDHFITHATFQCVGDQFVPLGGDEFQNYFGGPPCTCINGTLTEAGSRVWACTNSPQAAK